MVRFPAVVVHGLEQARWACSFGRPVTLLSAPGAGLFAGVLWWRALVGQCGTSGPDLVDDLLDCGDAAGRALEALASGCRGVVLHPCPGWGSVAERAAGCGAVLVGERPVALDLALARAPDLALDGAGREIAGWLGVA